MGSEERNSEGSQMIEVKDISKTYRVKLQREGMGSFLHNFLKPDYMRKEALKGITFTIPTGDIIGYIGPNGSGKSTTIKILCGILTPDGGEVQVDGETVNIRNNRFKRKIGVVFGQRSNLWRDLPAQDTFRLFRNIYGISEEEYRRNYEFINSYLDIAGLQNVPVRKLSLGQRMKCEIAAAMLHFPDILFLDEPTIGLDLNIRQKVLELFREYNTRFHKTIIITSHNLFDIEEICARLIVIDKGKVIVQDTLEEVKRQYLRYKLVQVSFVSDMDRERFDREIRETFGGKVTAALEQGKSVYKMPIQEKEIVNRFLQRVLDEDNIENFEVLHESMESMVQNILE